jgi:hypothetical protein
MEFFRGGVSENLLPSWRTRIEHAIAQMLLPIVDRQAFPYMIDADVAE